MFVSNVAGPDPWVEGPILVRMTWLEALDTAHVRAPEFALECACSRICHQFFSVSPAEYSTPTRSNKMIFEELVALNLSIVQ